MSSRLPLSSLRARVQLQAPIDASDATGALQRQWNSVADIWAYIEPLNGTQIFIAASEQSRIIHRVTIRWRSDVQGAMRFLFGDRTLYIRAVYDPDGRRRRSICHCEEFST